MQVMPPSMHYTGLFHTGLYAHHCTCQLQGQALACTLGWLYAGCVYQVRIRAKNGSGWGQYSVPSDVRAAAGVPHAPTAPRAVGQSAVAIEVAWDAPQHDGGSLVTSYRLEMSAGIAHHLVLYMHQLIYCMLHLMHLLCSAARWNHVPCQQSLCCHHCKDLSLAIRHISNFQYIVPGGSASQKIESSFDTAGPSSSEFRTVLTQLAASGCRADVPDLSPGTQYRFQVYAINSQGASPASSIGEQNCYLFYYYHYR